MIKVNSSNRVNAKDIYNFVEVKTRFNDWVLRCIDYADLKEGKDFNTFLSKSTGGRPSKEYDFSLQAAKEVCIVSATRKAKQLRRWLIELSEQKENLDLLTHDQVVMLSVLEGFFKYAENQKLYEKKHMEHFASSAGSRNPYAQFHNYRNGMLQIEPERIESALKEYCVNNKLAMPNAKGKRSKIQFLDNYQNLRNAVWDFLQIRGEVNSMKLANLVKRMAQAKNVELFEKNETNLFQQKESFPNIKKLGR